MKSVFGAFVFRNEGNGCLTSVYLEHKSPRPYTESCIRQGSPLSNDSFEGIFRSSWHEPDNRTAILTIQRNGDIYNLHWNNISDSDWEYDGTAILFENNLVGSYRKR